MKREYQVDLLDLYRGTLSVRLLGVYVRGLSSRSATVRAMNDGQAPWTRLEHLIADLWALLARVHFGVKVGDHPTRAAMESKARADAKQARVIGLKSLYEKLRGSNGLEG